MSLNLGIPQSPDSSEPPAPPHPHPSFHTLSTYINTFTHHEVASLFFGYVRQWPLTTKNNRPRPLPSHSSHGGRPPPQFLTLSQTKAQVLPLLLPEEPPPPPPRRWIPELGAQGQARPELVLLGKVPGAQRQVPQLHFPYRRRAAPPRPSPFRRLQVRRPQLRPQLRRRRRRPPLRRAPVDELLRSVASLAAVLGDHGLG